MDKLTQKIVREQLKALGVSFRKTSAGDFVVGTNEANKYFTNDLADALGTGKLIAASVSGFQTGGLLPASITSKDAPTPEEKSADRIARLISRGYCFEPIMLNVKVTPHDYTYILDLQGAAFEMRTTQDFEYAAKALHAYNAANPERYHTDAPTFAGHGYKEVNSLGANRRKGHMDK